MKKLNEQQIARINKKIKLNAEKFIVMLHSRDKDKLSEHEFSHNIYCIGPWHNIFWQVTETNRPNFGPDRFCYLGKNDQGVIRAGRFSGFEYVIDPETGVAEQTGWHK